jgi:hypothetical protein
MQMEHQDEILRYKGKLTTLEYELKSKNSQIELIANKLRKTEQELDIVRTRVEQFEVHFSTKFHNMNRMSLEQNILAM